MTFDVMEFVRNRWRRYVIFRKAFFFIWGLIAVHSWVDNALLALLITHLTDIMPLPKAASVVNLLDGSTAVLSLVNAYFSETFLGPFGTIVYTTIAYISGLLLLYLGAGILESIETRVLYVIVILIGSGRAGLEIELKEFLVDQCRTGEDEDEEVEEQVESRRKPWWRSAYILGVILSVYLFTKSSWVELCKISLISMGVAFVIFLTGYKFYYRKKPAKTTLHHMLLLFSTNTSPTHQIRTSRSWKELKYLVKMLPMWSTFLAYGLLLATGNTLFYQQTDFTANYFGHISTIPSDYSCNDPKLHISKEVPVVIFVVIRYATSFVVTRLCDVLLSSHWGKNTPRRVMVVRCGAGLTISAICCAVAWRVEEYRLQQRLNHAICLRFSWLMPQFVLLGLMEGLVDDGIKGFYVSLVPQSLKKYGPTFTLFTLNIGHFSSLPFGFIFGSLLNDNLNSSRLGVYYIAIGLICFVNLGIFCFVASSYIKQEVQEEEENMEQPLEQIQSMQVRDPEQSANTVVDQQVV